MAGPFQLIVYDFDGVMTDNRVLVLEDGTEAVFVSRSDGWAVGRIRDAGIPQLILSTEQNPVVAARARKLRIPVIHGSTDKAAALRGYTAEHGIDLEHCVFVGNDVNDLEVMAIVGLPVAPADSHPSVLAAAAHVLTAKGGAHAIREFYESFILGAPNCQGAP